MIYLIKNRKNHKWLLIIFFIILIMLYLLIRSYLPPTNHHTQLKSQAIPVVSVKVQEVQWHHWINVISTIRGVQDVILKAETPGKITEVYVKANQIVKKGQKLYQINPVGLTAKARKEEKQLELSNYHLSETEKLRATNNTSEWDYQQAKAKAAIAKEQLSDTKSALKQTQISAPFSGRTGVLLVHLGDYVKKGTPMIHIINDNQYRIDFYVPEKYIRKLNIGKIVHFDIWSERPC